MSPNKNFNFPESIKAQLRFEFFNVFNHTQWGNINTGLSAPSPGNAFTNTSSANYAGSSGQITSVRDPRQMQVGAKFYF